MIADGRFGKLISLEIGQFTSDVNDPTFNCAANNDVPPFVSLRGMSLGTEPGYLGVAHRPFTPDGPGLNNLRLNNGINAERMEDRKNLLGQFDTVRREIDASGTMKGMDAFTGRAFDMIASGTVRKALDLTQEDPRTRDRYRGVERFLTARRLIEAGVGCVTLSYGGWDTHANNFDQVKTLCGTLDAAWSTLMADLKDRGLLDSTTIVWMGEFGRTPKINQAKGRDHYPNAWSAVLAGGGIKGGQAIGKTSKDGMTVEERPVPTIDLLATVCKALGVNSEKQNLSNVGRPIRIVDKSADPLTEVLA